MFGCAIEKPEVLGTSWNLKDTGGWFLHWFRHSSEFSGSWSPLISVDFMEVLWTWKHSSLWSTSFRCLISDGGDDVTDVVDLQYSAHMPRKWSLDSSFCGACGSMRRAGSLWSGFAMPFPSISRVLLTKCFRDLLLTCPIFWMIWW